MKQSSQELNDAAARWWVEQDRGALDEHASLALEQWLTQPEHARAYARVRKSWAALEGADADPTIAALRQAAIELPRASRWTARRVGGFVGALAATCAAVAIGFVWLKPHLTSTSSPGTNAVTYRTQTGEQQTFDLADGSRITLDALSDLDVAFSPYLRLVNLHSGRARFDVAHDPHLPFVVEAGGHRIRAIGTSFDVQVSQGALDVLLVQGRLVVERAGTAATDVAASVALSPGQRFTAREGMPPYVAAADMKRETLWTQGFVEFDDERLDVAVAELNRYAVEPILIRDPTVARMKISGIFRVRQTQRFLDVVKGVLPVEVRAAADASAEIVPKGDRKSPSHD
jgi:transmembrane sensor